MTKQVNWSKYVLEAFIETGMLTKDEEMIMRTRVAGWTRLQQAEKLRMSVSTVDRLISSCKRKYDSAEMHNPLLPPRKRSSKELYMDEN